MKTILPLPYGSRVMEVKSEFDNRKQKLIKKALDSLIKLAL